MKLKPLSQILLGLSIAPIMALSLHQPSYAGQKYRCDTSGKHPITRVRTGRGEEPMLLWISNSFILSPEERCQIVSNRLQRYYDNQMMPYLTSRKNINGYPVLCIVDRVRGNCLKEDVVVTLKPGTDPGRVLRQIKYFRRGAAGARPVPLSGSKTVIYEDGEFYLNLNEILEEEN
ncbi:MAG: COP23 domain-containing protein [Cuspidothrix sp.]